jgi:hypothetical protein
MDPCKFHLVSQFYNSRNVRQVASCLIKYGEVICGIFNHLLPKKNMGMD